MDNKNNFTPDEPGWYFYKKSKKSIPHVVYINDDGRGFALNSDGESWEIDDLIGFWEYVEPETL